MNRDIVQSPSVERRAAYLAAIIYPLIRSRSPRLHWALRLEEGRGAVQGRDKVSVSPRSFFGGFNPSTGQTLVVTVDHDPGFSLPMSSKQMLIFCVFFFSGVHYSSLAGTEIAMRVSSGVKTLITALAKHGKIIYFTNTQKMQAGWD